MKAAVIPIVLIGLGQWGIGTAHADADTYLSGLRDGTQRPGVVFNQSSDALLALGYRVCANASAGVPERWMFQDIWLNNALNLDTIHATALVITAEWELCATYVDPNALPPPSVEVPAVPG